MSEENLLFELKAIKKTLTVAHSEKIEEYLSKVIKRERKTMWRFIDGLNNTSVIAEKSKVTPRSVQIFLNYGKELGIIEWEPRGIPNRIIDHVPANWIIDEDSNTDKDSL